MSTLCRLPLVVHLSRPLMRSAVLITALTPLYAMDGWTFNPPEDAYSADALLDLRPLNEGVAGETGFVKRTPDGEDFALGDGTPARFWCMNVNGGAIKAEDLAREARFLAKRGVNMVRLHMGLQPKDEGSQVTDVDQAQIERVWRAVATMKREGIYCTISPYWGVCGLKTSWGIEGHGSDSLGVLFCDRILQRGYKAWLKALYANTNPYTGIPLARDPAVGIIQLQNEDSLLFWTLIGFINARGKPFDELREQFGAWAVKRYGGIDNALKKWGGIAAPDDDANHCMLGFFQVWETTTNPGGPRGERVADQIEFLAQTMRDFNAAMEKYLREELGCKQLINAGNWVPADVVKQFDAEHWSYAANQVIAVNRYQGGPHHGPNAGWAIDPGDHYANQSITIEPTTLAINVKQVCGYPYLVTEGNWCPPDLWQSEAPLAVAAYSSLTGIDGYYWFASESPSWDAPQVPWGKMLKFNINTPMQVGQFPAAALIYRKGHLTRGTTVVHEERSLTDIWHECTPIIAESAGHDPNRDAHIAPTSAVKTTVNPLAFLVGKCEVVYGGDPAKSWVADLSKYIDETGKTIVSTTGEEKLDYGNHLLTIDAPNAQGVAGFLAKNGLVKLHDIDIVCANEYATVTVVAMDDKPIRQSGKLLVQIGTTCRPTGWMEHQEEFEVNTETHEVVKGFVIDSIGRNPWQVEKAKGAVTIRNPSLTSAVIVDANGMAVGEAQGRRTAGAYTLTLPPDALYVVLTSPDARRR